MRDFTRFNNASFNRGVPSWKEALWWLCRSLFFSTGFPVPSPLKVALLRLFGAQIGTGVVIRSRINISFPWKLTVANHVWIGDEVFILSLDHVRIGSHVCLSQRAFLCTGSHDHRRASFDLITKPIVIEDGCWVGAQAFVGPGVTLRSNTVVAAGAVVVKDAGPDELLGGNPAKVIRQLEEPV